jgi:hypothetical protein
LLNQNCFIGIIGVKRSDNNLEKLIFVDAFKAVKNSLGELKDNNYSTGRLKE